jgi:predicted RNase H-like HicB family nuclease
MPDFSFTTHIFREGPMYVAYVPALDVSSCGSTDEEARKNIRDAVRGFLAASAGMGTLDEIPREAGCEREGDRRIYVKAGVKRPVRSKERRLPGCMCRPALSGSRV